MPPPTLNSEEPFFVTRAHPRVGGENNTKAINGQTFTGSSPRRRGKPPGRLRVSNRTRLIPA